MGGSGKTELPILMYILFANPFHSFHNKSNFEPFNIKKKDCYTGTFVFWFIHFIVKWCMLT